MNNLDISFSIDQIMKGLGKPTPSAFYLKHIETFTFFLTGMPVQGPLKVSMCSIFLYDIFIYSIL